jgi:hypothetical protein
MALMKPEPKPGARERMLEILRGPGSAVAAEMTRNAPPCGMSATALEPIERCASHLIKYNDFLRV